MTKTMTAAKADALRKEAARLRQEASALRGNDLSTKEVVWWSQETGDVHVMRALSVVDADALRLWRAEHPGRDYARWFKASSPTLSPDAWDRICDLEQRACELDDAAGELAADKPKRKPGPEPVHDWDFLREKAFEALDERGQVGPHDWKQADLVRLLLAIMAAQPGGECDPSLMKKKVAAWCREWSEAVKAGRRV
jgi:hypothetical protein